MSRLWLLRGDRDAPGWQVLRTDQQEDRVEMVHLDPRVWAIIRAEEPPTGYQGVEAVEPPDGLYLDPNGSPLYLVAGRAVGGAEEVIRSLGEDATGLLETIGDPHTVLQKLGRVF
jgi:hypothetical protein